MYGPLSLIQVACLSMGEKLFTGKSSLSVAIPLRKLLPFSQQLSIVKNPSVTGGAS